MRESREEKVKSHRPATVCALFIIALDATQRCFYHNLHTYTHVHIQSTSAQLQRGVSVPFYCPVASWEQFWSPPGLPWLQLVIRGLAAQVLLFLFSLGAPPLSSGTIDLSVGTVTACFLVLAEGAVCVAPACQP